MLFAFGVAVASFTGAGRVSTDDRNGDGRPDVWRTYDAAGRLVEVAVDSNFDGRTDVREIYAGGTLVRRESDRNFDDRIDLVEDFDATTHEHVRSTVDTDYDGTADLLVLFQGGRPVYSSWASDRAGSTHDSVALPVAGDPTGPRGSLLAWDDPFSRDANLRTSVAPAARADVALTDGAAALVRVVASDEGPVASCQLVVASSRPRAPARSIRSPRAPPLA